MSHRLQKPITDKQRADFIVEYNHNQGLIIEDGSDTYEVDELTFKADYIFALEPNEMMVDVEVEIDVPDEVEEEQEEPTYHKETVIVHKPLVNPHYEEEQAEKERIRIANLHMTRGDVFRGLLLAKGVTRAELRAIIEAMPETTPQEKIAKEYALIDFDEALEFYRGVSLIDTVGDQLGISSVQMDRFFDTKDWHELLTPEPESEETDDI